MKNTVKVLIVSILCACLNLYVFLRELKFRLPEAQYNSYVWGAVILSVLLLIMTVAFGRMLADSVSAIRSRAKTAEVFMNTLDWSAASKQERWFAVLYTFKFIAMAMIVSSLFIAAARLKLG